MDQGRADSGHHRSKSSRLQVTAQLAHRGLREPALLAGRPVVRLASPEASDEQRLTAFARKTYRFYEGGRVTLDDVRALLAPGPPRPRPGRGHRSHRRRTRPPAAVAGPAPERRAPAAEVRLRLSRRPLRHPALPGDRRRRRTVGHLLPPPGRPHPGPGRRPPSAGGAPGLTLHFLGKRRAIEPVYRNNIGEVLEFEAGHMLGVLEEVLPCTA
ncbi:hypothetical protein ACFQ60_07465 [Streptomyces zhihengii]